MIDIKEIAQKRLSETDLTVQELLTLVDQIVTERLKAAQPLTNENRSTLLDWWQSMVNEIIIPESGTPSATEMLREERDQWYKPS